MSCTQFFEIQGIDSEQDRVLLVGVQTEDVFISATERLGLETLKVRSLQLIDERFEPVAVPQNSY
ncbi:MAG: hypothetical protein RMY36_029850 [Nostoc sp. SerVER01]|nr:hypothetical protein [Nostoc sp. SerVER01]